MLERLKLTKFSQHLDRTFDFTQGVNAMRGANEAGKSRIFVAVMYGLFGSRAIPFTVEELVTWGYNENELRVDLVWTHAGERYTLYRTAKSAEMTGPGFTASGQSAVTAKVTQLLGADMNIAVKVLIANQDDIRKALEDGSSQLIEDLSQVNLLDTLVLKLQTHMPTGKTKDLDFKLAALEQDLGTGRPERSFALESKAVADGESNVALLVAALTSQQEELARLAPLKAKAEADIAYMDRFNSARDVLSRDWAKLRANVDSFIRPEVPDPSALEVLNTEQSAWLGEKALYDQFKAIRQAPPEDTRAGYMEYLADWEAKSDAYVEKLAKLQVELAHARKHTNPTLKCNACGRAFDNAEDAAKQAEVAKAEVTSLEVNINMLQAGRKVALERHAKVEAAAKADTTQSLKMLATFGNKVSVVGNSWPSQWQWDGRTDFPAVVDYTGRIRQARKDREAALTKINTYDGWVARIAELDAEMAVKPDVVDLAKARDNIAEYSLLAGRVDATKDSLRAAESVLTAAKNTLTSLQVALETEQARWDERKAEHTQLAALIQRMVHNNGIIRKLRDSRPVVANQLWAQVLVLASDFFTQIRGVQSVVTRQDNSFYVDGKKAKLYSGSTLDSLGLAVRMALHRIFLGTVDFMMTDEPARGMDAEREVNLLAAISRLDIPQAVVVTHSDRIQTFAASVIEV